MVSPVSILILKPVRMLGYVTKKKKKKERKFTDRINVANHLSLR